MYGVWIIPVAIFLLFVIINLIREDFEFGGIWTAIGTLLAIITVACLGIGWLVDNDKNETPVKESEVELTALQDGRGTTGGYYLGSWSRGGRQNYYYMESTGKGTKMGNVGVEYAYINEVEQGTKATLETYKLRRDSGFKRFLYGEYNVFKKEYRFNVPEGTLTTDFTVDMK